jgi:phosphate acetyltransferase
MTRTLLVVPAAAGASLARTCLGLVRALDRQGVNVAFIKPVAQPRADGGPDRSIALAAATTALRPPDPLSTAHLEQQLGSGGLDAVLEKIVAAWQPVHDRSDVVVVEGLSAGPAKLYASGLNQALAKAVDADVVLVASWPAAGVVSGADRTEGAAGLDPAGDAVKQLAESLAITASG